MIPPHPLQRVSPGAFWALYWFALGATFFLAAALGQLGRPYESKMGAAGQTYTVLDLEFAGSARQLDAMLEVWGPEGRRAAIMQTLLDYFFLLAYSTTIAMGVLALAGHTQGRMAAAGVQLAWGQWLAAALDALENSALLVSLLGTPANPWPQIAFACAAAKFALVFAGLLYVLFALPLAYRPTPSALGR
ncbi:MAG: hypothetical protein HYV26_09415 [Candidatus Hydrogenedentes bacterium]|nr:hypothetical protein [Candidatus Hydrogenedentota bacterium]MBI3118001.1 hypothetical protein [Candidatus Hydrogenedentota bacterium]